MKIYGDYEHKVVINANRIQPARQPYWDAYHAGVILCLLPMWP